jgi:hypothetical protein
MSAADCRRKEPGQVRSNLQGPLRAEATAILKNAVRLEKKPE